VPTDEQLAEIKFTAAGMVCGQERVKQVAGFKAIKLGPAPKVLVHLELPSAAAGEASGVIPEVTIVPGERTVCKLRVERRDFKDRIAFDVANLPHGVIVDDIGLSGVLIPEGQTERTIFLRAEPWVPEQLRLFFATAQVDGNQCSRPMLLRVVPGPATDSPATSALPAP
jgi:hypothetical protein